VRDRSTRPFATGSASQESGFETFGPRPASDVVSGSLVEGPHYRLAPTVKTFAFQNHFVVSSDYGISPPQAARFQRRPARAMRHSSASAYAAEQAATRCARPPHHPA
jgi:hypothetical protein